MGLVKKLVKTGASAALDNVKSAAISSAMNSNLASQGIDKVRSMVAGQAQVPKINVGDIKMPAGVDKYISPVADKVASHINIPTSFNGVSLPKIPELPDLSSVSSEVGSKLSSIGLDTDKLGIRSVDDILKNPDISALKASDLGHTPKVIDDFGDVTKAMDQFDINAVQDQINGMTSKFPGVEKMDLTKYF
ncbi:MAG: hypothetical protein J6U54_17970 [Clostridiales bacterium]|nr:hypothetical protein [Clostridiales bacterium]